MRVQKVRMVSAGLRVRARVRMLVCTRFGYTHSLPAFSTRKSFIHSACPRWVAMLLYNFLTIPIFPTTCSAIHRAYKAVHTHTAYSTAAHNIVAMCKKKRAHCRFFFHRIVWMQQSYVAMSDEEKLPTDESTRDGNNDKNNIMHQCTHCQQCVCGRTTTLLQTQSHTLQSTYQMKMKIKQETNKCKPRKQNRAKSKRNGTARTYECVSVSTPKPIEYEI